MNDTELALYMKRSEDVIHDVGVLHRSKNFGTLEFITGTLAYIASINSESSDPQQSMNGIIKLFRTLCDPMNKGDT